MPALPLGLPKHIVHSHLARNRLRSAYDPHLDWYLVQDLSAA